MTTPTLSLSSSLQQRLDAFVSGDCSPDAFVQELSAVCDATPDSAWEALSLIDQYYRRGKLSADVFRTVTYGIERHVLGVRDSDARKPATAPVAAGAGGSAARSLATSVKDRAPTPKEPASDVRAMQRELLNARATARRYRRRLAILAAFGHRTRSALESAEHELQVLRTQVVEHGERLRSREWRRSAREQFATVVTDTSAPHPPTRMRPSLRSSQAVALATVLLAVGASPALQDLPPHRNVANKVVPTAAAVVIAPVAEPGQISLSTDQYVVLPHQKSAEIDVQRTGGASGDVSFVWWTRASGATPGSDYVAGAPRMAHMPDGVDTLHLSIPILANPSRKHTEMFYVGIGKPGGGAALGSLRRATVVIMRPD
jgi:hypothetical protein